MPLNGGLYRKKQETVDISVQIEKSVCLIN